MALERYNGSGSGGTKVPTGYAEQIVMNDSTFRAKRRELEAELHPPAAKKLKREKRGDSSIASGAGAYRGPWARWEAHAPDAIEGEDEELEVEVVSASEYEEDAIQAQPAAPKGLAGTAYSEAPEGAETTELFGELYDYQGRSYLHVPTSLGINLRSDEPQKSYHPKKLLHTWKKHTKAITQTRFFPGSGHLLLSASADSKIFLWDVYNERECLRGFYGHNRMVNDIDFEPDGRGFFSAGYDRKIKRWDTETGACTWKYSGTALAHCVRVKHSEPNMFLAGMSNNKILEFDTRAPGEKPEREYDHHLGPVNTITYWDEDRRFMSTSDDKSLRVWEWGFNVPSKIIAEPHMFAMTRAASHPSGKYVLYQAANEILAYQCKEKGVRQDRKKGFRGHNNAGFGIDVAVSPDGSLVASGDAGGYVCFWDWKTCKMWHKIPASKDGAVLSVQWHPKESSKVVTGDINGTLKYWD